MMRRLLNSMFAAGSLGRVARRCISLLNVLPQFTQDVSGSDNCSFEPVWMGNGCFFSQTNHIQFMFDFIHFQHDHCFILPLIKVIHNDLLSFLLKKHILWFFNQQDIKNQSISHQAIEVIFLNEKTVFRRSFLHKIRISTTQNVEAISYLFRLANPSRSA